MARTPIISPSAARVLAGLGIVAAAMLWRRRSQKQAIIGYLEGFADGAEDDLDLGAPGINARERRARLRRRLVMQIQNAKSEQQRRRLIQALKEFDRNANKRRRHRPGRPPSDLPPFHPARLRHRAKLRVEPEEDVEEDAGPRVLPQDDESESE